MSLTLQLPPGLEDDLRRAAEREGVAPEAFALGALQERVHRELQQPATETGLLQQINQGLPVATWERYHELIAKREDGQISDTEYAELLELVNEVETWNVHRLEFVSELARRRGVTLRSLVEELGLAPAPNA